MYNKSELALFYEKAGRGVCSHAYIVDGAAGIGKLEFALSCARALLCTGKTKPCGICQSCRKFSLGGHPDIHITGTGEKCAGVDDIRELIRLASVMPNDGDMQVFIIANAGKMRAGAQNALLKLFEEPPPTVTVFLLTETRNSLLPTLLSRGQRIHLDGMSPKEALAELAARCGGSGGEAERALEAANGSVGEAERLLSPESAENRKKACEILLYALSGKSYELSKALLLPKYKREKLYDILDSLLLLLLIIVSVAVCIRLKTGGPMIGLFASWIFIYLFCKIFGISYANIVAGAYDAIRMVVPTLCLLMAIGVMIGTWLQSGTIATIISWGLKMINPSWLLPLTLLFCSILSIVTGTSYGSVGSAGVAMMAIGNAMGIHPGMVAGAVICGAMFGDKLSPLSDTTNLAPAVADAKLGDHIRSMLWTTLPTYVITLILFTILGFQQTSGSYTEGSITVYIDALNGEFQLGWITMIPAILIIVLLLCKVNAISALGLSSFAAGFVSYFVQHDTLQGIIRTAYNGYTTAIEEPVLQSILNRGGMGSMLQYVAIICFAVGMGGMLEKLGVLDHILQAIVKRINSDGSMILATMIVGYVTSLISCSQPMAHVLTGRLMAPVFQERKVAPEILSRCLEDSGTMAGPMIPWHGYGVYMAGTLGVAWSAFFPYLFLLYLTPVFSIFYGFTGISIKHLPETKNNESKEEK